MTGPAVREGMESVECSSAPVVAGVAGAVCRRSERVAWGGVKSGAGNTSGRNWVVAGRCDDGEKRRSGEAEKHDGCDWSWLTC